jgi:cytochrome c peroxidase
MANPVLTDAIARANTLRPTPLSDTQIAELVAFLKALTDPAFRDANHLVPDHVPSGLPVDK